MGNKVDILHFVIVFLDDYLVEKAISSNVYKVIYQSAPPGNINGDTKGIVYELAWAGENEVTEGKVDDGFKKVD